MARKARDYKAEERRRNELAKQRGFSNRYQQRAAIETGKRAPLQPSRVRSPRTKAAQRRVLGAHEDYLAALRRTTPASRAEDWSGLFLRTDMAKYDPDRARELGVSRAAYTDAYLNAWVEGPESYSKVRHKGGSDALEYWFVTLNGFMTVDEYEARYGRGK